MTTSTAASSPSLLRWFDRPRDAAPSASTLDSSDDASDEDPVFATWGESALFYDPPYASDLHDAMAWELVKHLDDACGLRDGVTAPSVGDCAARADFLVEAPSGLRVAFVLTEPDEGPVADDVTPDGPETHARQRDALLIGTGTADVVYRVRRTDAAHRLHDVLLLAARWERALFSGRAQTNLQTLAAPEARGATIHPGVHTVALTYAAAHGCTLVDVPGGDAPTDTLVVDRLDRRHPVTWREACQAARARLQPRHAMRAYTKTE